ncbi:MAG TPA: TlpA disulfide reductase family protein [Allosphingosinicella sp.]|nr:TlpA disulfide reductase family protein [Allosphingosinicella sp.]
MPEVVTLGPLAFPMDRLVAVALIWGFLAAALWVVRDARPSGRRMPWLALAIGLLIARLNFVVFNWEAYRSEPATIVYLWQGGFDPLAGIIAAAVALAVGLRSLRRAGGTLLALGAASALWLGFQQLEATGPRPPFPRGVMITGLDGQPVSLDDLGGRPFVVNLWASWCGPCRREMPMLIETARASDVPVLLINQGEDQQTIRRFLREENLPADNVLSDRGAALMRLTGSAGLPTTLFVRADGLIEQTHVGEISKAGLLSEVRNLAKSSPGP